MCDDWSYDMVGIFSYPNSNPARKKIALDYQGKLGKGTESMGQTNDDNFWDALAHHECDCATPVKLAASGLNQLQQVFLSVR